MPPNVIPGPIPSGVLFEDDVVEEKCKQSEAKVETPAKPFKTTIVWRNVAIFVYLHVAALYGLYLMFTSAKWQTNVYTYLSYVISGYGITAGVHRLWAHRAYKVKLPLKIFLVFCNLMAYQDSVIRWCRTHRVHHKFTETLADPHDRNRGFFFSHIGWLLSRKRPEVKEAEKLIDVSDLESDPVLAFQDKYYYYLMPLICFILPTFVPVYLWGETWSNSWHVSTIFRYVLLLNCSWLVNSAAHTWGSHPYDKRIVPRENLLVSIASGGEGWHNFHHVFPWDYKTAELGNYRANITTAFIDLMAKIGLAYDLKTVSAEMLKARVERTGDGSHEIWGWGDKDMREDDKKMASTLSKKGD